VLFSPLKGQVRLSSTSVLYLFSVRVCAGALKAVEKCGLKALTNSINSNFLLWNNIYPQVYALRNGAELDHGVTRAKMFDAKCPDECRVCIHGEVLED